jgi:hypothetical protein
VADLDAAFSGWSGADWGKNLGPLADRNGAVSHILTQGVSRLAPPADGNRAREADLDTRIKSPIAKKPT